MRFVAIGHAMGFTEGPVFTQDGRLLVVSIDQGRIYQLRSGPAQFEVAAEPGDGPNGLAEGPEGRLYVAQNGGRWNAASRPPRPGMTGGVQSVDRDGRAVWLTRDLVSPNDLCFGPDGLLYVSDPTRQLLDDGRIWRCDVRTGEAEILASLHWYPNGIAFGLEDDAVYVASTRNGRIMRFPLCPAGLGTPDIFAQMPRGRPDGLAFDAAGSLAVCAVSNDDEPGEVQIWSRQGELLDVIRPGPARRYTNIAISVDRRVALTDSDSGRVLLADEWPVAGLALYPFRRVLPRRRDFATAPQ